MLEFNNSFLQQRKNEQQIQVIDKAQAKIEAFRELNSEIETDMAAIVKGIDELSLKLKVNMKSEDNQAGLLTR